MSTCLHRPGGYCNNCELPGEPKRPRRIILTELRGLLEVHSTPADFPWAFERLAELEAGRQLELFR